MARDESEIDAQLLAAARSGDRRALEALWTRHEAAVRNYARQLARPSDVDELVSESFYRVLKAILDGGGPETAFRAYVLTTLRRALLDLGRGYHQRVRLTGDDRDLDSASVPSAADSAADNADRSAAWRAWQSLPEDSRNLLRQLIIEERTPAELAPLLGTTPNGVASRGLRARERLRQAYLQQHLRATEDAGCNWTRSRLGEYTRQGLARRERQKVQQHLHACAWCTAAAAELADLNRVLRTGIGPALFGGLLLLGHRLVSTAPKLGAAAHRLAAAKVVVATGTIAAAVLLVPLTKQAGPQTQQADRPPVLPISSVPVSEPTTSRVPASSAVPVPGTSRRPATSTPSASDGLLPISRPTDADPAKAPATSPVGLIDPVLSGAPTSAVQASTPAVSSPPSAQPSPPSAGFASPTSRSDPVPAPTSPPASTDTARPSGVDRTVPVTLTIGGRHWLPGVLTVTVPDGWTISSLASTGPALPCTVQSPDSASCQVSGPASRTYTFDLTVTGPATGTGDRLAASYAKNGTTLLTFEQSLD